MIDKAQQRGVPFLCLETYFGQVYRFVFFISRIITSLYLLSILGNLQLFLWILILPVNNYMKWLLFLSAFYRCGNWNEEKFNNFPKVTQLITKTWIQEVWPWSLCSWLLHYKCCLYCCLLGMLTTRMCPEGKSLNWKDLCRIVD